MRTDEHIYVKELPSVHPHTPYDYLRILAGPAARWYKPLLSLLLCVVLGFVLQLLILLPLSFVYVAVAPDSSLAFESVATMDMAQPLVAFVLLFSVACFLPAAMASHAIVYKQRPGRVFSLIGKIRIKLLLLCLIPGFLVLGGFNCLQLALEGASAINPRPDYPLLVMVLLVFLPFQICAEEFIFRGLLLQYIGSWFRRNKKLALVMSFSISSMLFALAHGSFDLFTFLHLCFFGLCAAFLVLKTGGLEAALALHFTNNFVILAFTGLQGVSTQSLAGQTQVGFGEFLLAAVMLLLVSAAQYGIFYHFKKKGEYSAVLDREIDHKRYEKLSHLQASQLSKPSVAGSMQDESYKILPQEYENLVENNSPKRPE